jgi:c(7)-type cytochrome triheme protein
MKIAHILVAMLAAIAFGGTATATPPGKNLDYAGGGMGKVVFDGKVHADKGLKCNDCHTKVFKMKKGSDKLTMAAMKEGKQCGTCHNGTKAFKTDDPAKCTTCHKK